MMAHIPHLETVLIESISPAVALLSYNQPHISNAFTVQQYRDTNTALTWTLNEPEVNVIVMLAALSYSADHC
jgi:1,4-dihydroxy-2-naphthoyl-CoA synthase